MGRALGWLSRLAVIALALRTMRQMEGGSAPPHRMPTASTKPRKRRAVRQCLCGVWRWLGRYSEMLVMIAITVVGFGAGLFVVLAPHDVDPPPPTGLLVTAQAQILDGKHWWPLSRVQIAEIHSGWPKSDPPVAPHAVRLNVTLVYDKPVFDYEQSVNSKDAAATVAVYLPPGAEVANFRDLNGVDGLHSNVAPRKQNWHPDTPGSYGSNAPAAVVDGVVQAGKGFLNFSIDVKNVEGVSFRTNRTRARAQIPVVYPSGGSPMPMSSTPYVVSVEDVIQDASSYTWSLRPNLLNPQMSVWEQKSNEQTVVPINGVRDDLLRDDHDREVKAGIVFGVSGGAAIGVVQTWFSARRRRAEKSAD